MSTDVKAFGIDEVVRPDDRAALKAAVADIVGAGRTFLPISSGNRLGWGAPCGEIHTLLSTSALDRILRMDPDDFTCGVEPGVTLAVFGDALKEKGLAFEPGPFDTRGSRTIGGLLAEAPPSTRGWVRGSLRSQVLGIRAVDAHGREFKSGGAVVKNVAGYDIGKLFVGSGGAWFTVVEIQLRLVIRPRLSYALSSKVLEVKEAFRSWMSLQRRLPEARGIDLVFDGAEGTRVEVLMAGPGRSAKTLGNELGLEVVAEEDAWDRWSHRPDPGDEDIVLRGRILPSTVTDLLESLPPSTVGRVHRHGAFELRAGDFGHAHFPPDAIVRPVWRGERAGEPVSTQPDAAMVELGRRLKKCFGEKIAPDRLSFDTPLPPPGRTRPT